MATPRASDILGHVTLVTGPEEFLNQRTVSTAIAAVRAADPESEVSETTADQVSMAVLGDLAAPSLFSSIRCVVLRGLEDLPDDAHDGLVAYAGAPSEDIGLILVHSGGQKGSGLLDQAAQGADGHRGEVGLAQAVGVLPLRLRRGARRTAAGSPRTPPTCWSRRSARTCGPWRVRPASSPATSPASRSPSRSCGSTSAVAPR